MTESMNEPDRPPRPDRRSVLAGALAFAILSGGVYALARPWAPGDGEARRPRPTAPAAHQTAESPSKGALPFEPELKIAFAGQASGGVFHIHVINADGTGDTPLTFGADEERDPAWSPDRTQIAFDRWVATTDPFGSNGDIYVMHADGTGSFRLTSGPGEKGDPAWSPDGTRVAFFTTDPTTRRKRIALQRIDGGPPATVSDPPDRCNDREPSWSPDGLQLVFVRKCGDQPSGLYLLDLAAARGSGIFLLTAYGRTPDWSPDGAKVVYTGFGAGGPSVYVINVDGTGKTKLTDGPLSGDPEWSPDGSRIVFAVGDSLAVHLFVMNADGTHVRRLTTSQANDITASW
jgi:Tol biopolymer transport system component